MEGPASMPGHSLQKPGSQAPCDCDGQKDSRVVAQHLEYITDKGAFRAAKERRWQEQRE